MKHVQVISRAGSPVPAETTLIETLILLILTTNFSDWDNYPQIIRNLQKFYQKT